MAFGGLEKYARVPGMYEQWKEVLCASKPSTASRSPRRLRVAEFENVIYLETRGDVLLRNKEVFKLWQLLGLNTMFLGLPSLSETNFTFTRAADDADARSIIIPKNSSMRRAWAPRFSAFRLLLAGNWRDRLFTNAIRVADRRDRRCSQS